MNNKNLVRVMMVLIVFLGVLISLSGCFPNGGDKSGDNKASTENEEVNEASTIPKIGQDQPIYDFYHQVEMNQTKVEVDSALGVNPIMDVDGSYIYTDPSTGYSIGVLYSTDDLVTAKKVFQMFEESNELLKLSTTTVTESQVSSIIKDMPYEDVKNILGGDGLEAGTSIQPGSNDKVAYLLIWLNPDLSFIGVSFDGDSGKVLAANFFNAPV